MPVLRFSVSLLACWLVSAVVAAHEPAASDCAAAATRFATALDSQQHRRAAWPFAAVLREQWSYRPGSAFRRQGIRTGELSDEQRRLAQSLLRCGLSSQGYLKAGGIIQLDELVRERAGEIVMNDGSAPVEIGPEWFWFTLFGAPGDAAPWGFQVEGHHLTLNMTIVDGRLAVTPAFFGVWPATVEAGPLAGWRLLAGEEERAFALAASLTDRQRQRALLSTELPPGIFTSPERTATLARYEGLPATALDPVQRRALLALVQEYIGNFAPDIASEWLQAIKRDQDRLHLAWMGALEPGKGTYYRIHGPSILIEFDHASNIRVRGLPPDPNHIHTIVRRPGRDLGEDLLAAHYRNSRHHQSE